MSETKMFEKNLYPSSINFVDDDNQENTESYTISAEEAAKILGVNRSRLSQLTSKGAFPYEKRKIDTRNRLFYRLNDLLTHQRAQMLGSAYEYIPIHPAEGIRSPAVQDTNIDVSHENSAQCKNTFHIPTQQNKRKQIPLKSSATILFEQEKELENDKKIFADVEFIKQKIFAQEKELAGQKEFFKKEEFILQHKLIENICAINKLKLSIFSIQNKLADISIENKEIKEKIDKYILSMQKTKNWSQKKPKYRVSHSAARR